MKILKRILLVLLILIVAFLTVASFYRPLCQENKIYDGEKYLTVKEVAKITREIYPKNYELARLVTEAKISNFHKAVREYHPSLKAQKEMSSSLYKNITEQIGVLENWALRTEYVMVIRENGTYSYNELSEVLSTYDNQMIEYIMQDIRILYDFFDLELFGEVLINCGMGSWITMSYEELGISSGDELTAGVISDHLSAIGMLCQEGILNSIGEGFSAGDMTGFSGMTGFDPFDMLSLCGSDAFTSGTTYENMYLSFEHALGGIENNCGGSPQETIMAESTGNEQPDDLETPDQTVEEKLNEDVVSQETETGIIETGDNAGQPYETVTTTYADGTVVIAYREMDWEGNILGGVTQVNKPDGGKALDVWNNYDDNTANHYVWSRSSNGKKVQANYTHDKSNNTFRWNWSCVDETCNSCITSSLMEWYTNAMYCTKSGGLAPLNCDAFLRNMDCCNSMFPGDPRIAMMDPNGFYGCAGDEGDLDLSSEACALKCSVAYGEDCLASCNEGPPTSILLVDNIICLYAIWEECYMGSDIDLPGHVGGQPGIGPQPIPTIIERHLEIQPEILENTPEIIDWFNDWLF